MSRQHETTDPPDRASLEDLFCELSPDVPRRGVPRALKDLFFAAAVGLGSYATLRVLTLLVPYVVLFGVVYASILLRRLLAGVRAPRLPADMYSPAWGVTEPVDPRSAQVDGVVRAVRRWEARFGWTERDRVRFASAVRPRLAELVEERLRQRHGVSPRVEPEHAQEIIGDRLWSFLHRPIRRSPTPRDMAAIVAEMERL